MRFVRNVMLALAAVGFAIVAAPSCDDDMHHSHDHCDYVVRRCRTYCDYGYSCDSYWGCCYDRCWYDCVANAQPEQAPPYSPPPSSSTPPPPASDASADVAVLCSPCTSNDQCKGGGLCIQRGGEDAGASGFCGSPCNTGADCPAEFTCTAIGESKQCVPTSGACN